MTGNGAGTSGNTGATCCHIIYRRYDRHPERSRGIPPSYLKACVRDSETARNDKKFMKKIGILFGQANSFPWAFIDRVNQKTGGKEIVAEAVKIDKVIQGESCGYDVIVDRISQDVPFYRGFLKNAALAGTAVLNNPFWWSADDKFFNNALAIKIGVAVPRTVLLPSHEVPPETNANSFRNLAYPRDCEAIFDYVGWPAFFKPFAGGGCKNVYRLHNPEEFYRAYSETGQLVMMLQEEVKFELYFRCIQSINAMSASCPTIRGILIICDIKPSGKPQRKYCRMSSAVSCS